MKTIIWDFHGTLGRRSYSQTMEDLLRELHPELGITRKAIGKVMNGGYLYDRYETDHSHLNEPEVWNAYMADFFAKGFEQMQLPNPKDLGWQTVRRYAEPEGYTIYDDSVWALKTLKDAGWRHIILSNHIPELPDIVSALPIQPYIDVVYTSARTGYEKPHPKMYEVAQREVGDHPCIMIGDNPVADYHGARACGIPAIQVRIERAEEVKYYAKDMQELIALITNGYEDIVHEFI